MPVNSRHPDYDAMLPRWAKTSDVLAGDARIKGCGEKYLPMLTGQEPEEYEAYKERAVFMEITTRTRESFVGFIYRQDPDITFPAIIQPFIDDATLTGLAFYDYLKERIADVVGLGRGGTLIEYNEDAKRPFVRAYSADNIINWKVGKVAGKYTLKLLTLEEQSDEWFPNGDDQPPDQYEHATYTQWRVFELMQDTPDGSAYVMVKVWRRKLPVRATKGGTDRGGETVEEDRESAADEFIQVGTDFIPHRRGTPLSEIPFVFHGPNNYLAAVDVIPMEGIANINVSHYRTSADLENGRHFTGLPTLYAVGFDNADEIPLGSTQAFTKDEANGNEQIGFVQVQGEFAALTKAIEEKQGQMAALGARLLDFQKKDVEAYETARMRQTGETVTLANIAIAGTQAGSRILQWLTWWQTAAATVELCAAVANIELNTEFIASKIDPAKWQAANSARAANQLSPEAYYHVLNEGEVYPPEWDFEKEKAAIERAMPDPLPGEPGGPPLPGGGGNPPAGGRGGGRNKKRPPAK